MMKKLLMAATFVVTMCIISMPAHAQFGKLNKKHLEAATKGVKALTLSDADMAQYCEEYVQWLDEHNPLCSVNDTDAGKKAVAERLAKIVEQLPYKQVNGMNLDIQAYYVVDINAFACANGTIRVFAGLMEVMTDDEILAVIGHEIGHVANRDSKDAFKTALLTSALKDAVASTSGQAQALTESQLGSLSEALTNAQFSQKQENAADKYGYEFLKECGKDPKNMASSLGVLLKLQQEAGGGEDSRFNKLFSTHPDLDKRIANLEKMKG